MASLLQQGIAAFKNGDTDSARTLFEQVLQIDDENDRALVWLSRVTHAPAEQKKLLERALRFNPNNADARSALEQFAAATVAASPVEKPVPPAVESPSRGLLKQSRKPFPIDETDASPPNAPMEIPPADDLSALRNASVPTDASPSSSRRTSASLLPLILIGALSVTAIGGLLMLIFVLALT